MDFRIPVYAKFSPRKNVQMNGFKGRRAVLNELIEKGLRARLTTQSYLTGQLMIELEMMPDTKAVLKQEGNDLFEIPTVLSQMGKLSQGIQDLPVRDSVLKFNIVMERLNKEVIPNVNKLIENLNTVISVNKKEITKTLYNTNQTLTDVSMAAKSLRNFADYIERHPESLLKGKKDK
jgi:paraquat-inducible protein B